MSAQSYEDTSIRAQKVQALLDLLAAGTSDCPFVQPDKLRIATYSSGGLVIKGSASALAKTVATVYYRIGRSIYTLAAGDMPALSGTVANAAFNVFAFYVNAAGTVTSAMGTAAATLGAVIFPTVPSDNALLGFLVINPTGTGNFVGGTTALDDATVVPNVGYVNTTGLFVQP